MDTGHLNEVGGVLKCRMHVGEIQLFMETGELLISDYLCRWNLDSHNVFIYT